MYSAAQSLSVSFGKVECSSVQISLARCSDFPVWYFPVQSRVVQCSAVWWGRAQSKTVQSSGAACCPAQYSPLHWHAVQSMQWNLRPSSPISIYSLPAKYISIQHSPGLFKSTAVKFNTIKCSAEHCRAVHSVAALPSPVPSSPEQLTAVESSTMQSCSVKLGTTKCIAARLVNWSAIRKSPHWSPYKRISVQSCLQLSHQHNQERLLTALS